MIIAAFDPGLSGACAQIEFVKGRVKQAQVFDLPTMGVKSQLILNGSSLASSLRNGIDFAAIERVHAWPKGGVSGMFRFGTVFGQILGVVQTLGIPYELIEPSKWKRGMRLPGGDGKEEIARLRALELFPLLSGDLQRKKDHNRAEALLLGRWWLKNNATHLRVVK